MDASIKSSPLWPLFEIFRLTIPIRNAQDPEFSSFVDEIGEGAGPEIPLNMISSVSSTHDLIHFVYPQCILNDPTACLKRAILCLTNIQVDNYNDTITSYIQGAHCTYHTADSLQEVDDSGPIPPDSVLDYFATHTPPGLPRHTLRIKHCGK